jgi:transketolase C-terminal domain/subunit
VLAEAAIATCGSSAVAGAGVASEWSAPVHRLPARRTEVVAGAGAAARMVVVAAGIAVAGTVVAVADAADAAVTRGFDPTMIPR